MEKFLCKNCGACCTKFSLIGALPFFEWEIKEIKNQASKRKISLNIQPINIMFDEVSGIYFFPQYGMFNEPCPFLKENKCSIYEKRSYVCRMFPLIKTPLSSEDKIWLDSFSFCPNFDMQKFLKETEKLNHEELKEKFQEFFGECNEVCFRAVRTRDKLDEIMKKLLDEGKVKLRNVFEGEKILNAIPILEFFIKIKAINSKEKIKIINYFRP